MSDLISLKSDLQYTTGPGAVYYNNVSIQLQEPKVCEKYLRRLFTGVGRLVRGKGGRIEALVSPQEEVLHLAKVHVHAPFHFILRSRVVAVLSAP